MIISEPEPTEVMPTISPPAMPISTVGTGRTAISAILPVRGRPDVVVISGDLTSNGFKDEYVLAREYLNRVDCEAMVVIPGNHDSRNVGYVHFEELFGTRNSVLRLDEVTIVAVDSSEPDLDNGQIGRGRYGWIEEQFADPADLKVFVVHHHLLPVPGTGRR